MLRRLIGLFFLLLLATVGIVDALAYRYYWYWHYWWLDMIMHGLAGLAIGLFVVLLWRGMWKQLEAGLPRRRWLTPTATAGLSLCLGLIWEVYELVILMVIGGYHADSFHYLLTVRRLDTLSDLYFDTLGGFIAGLITERLSQWQKK